MDSKNTNFPSNKYYWYYFSYIIVNKELSQSSGPYYNLTIEPFRIKDPKCCFCL